MILRKAATQTFKPKSNMPELVRSIVKLITFKHTNSVIEKFVLRAAIVEERVICYETYAIIVFSHIFANAFRKITLFGLLVKFRKFRFEVFQGSSKLETGF